ncbi:MAG: hypothetical protein A3J66_03545 [Candidatus Magasanikbacteria bacterium RIFCSPHIGHO2_02_FULL_47_14]|uniref:Uncharacterized protein n=1 Tax=Candidatus Magasanikbacteria bacterium RIFCSPHIGHO2_02_FULL_47_14 TaxID=1798680 RepID=A0A1F6MB80_9BACT|nr:MAG: hypothetical protein A3J66_03545 [Candidatus Magasanikbacteria bacterium RIFCSPHIGHO2_02_FULL_47_14]
MNYKRAIIFGVVLYAVFFILYGLSYVVPFLNKESSNGLKSYIFTWVINIPVVLLLGKWYFKALKPSVHRGFWLGVITILVAFALDGIFVLLALAFQQPLDDFKTLYTDWKFYTTLAEVILLCTVSGFEFDATYSKDK